MKPLRASAAMGPDGARSRTLLRVGVAGAGVFAVALAILHVLNLDELGSHGRHVSNFAYLRGAWLWDVGLLGLAAGTLCLPAGLRRVLDVRGPSAWGLWTFQAAGVPLLLMVVYRTDRFATPDRAVHWSGYVHDASAVTATFLMAWSMLALVAASRVDPAWRGVPGRSWLWPGLAIGCGLGWMACDVTQFWPVAAVLQRAVIATMVAWMVTVGVRAQGIPASANGTPQPVPPPRPTR